MAWMRCRRVYIAPPAIDPLTVKNIPLEPDKALKLVAAMGVDPARPLVTQVSRFDLWKDPWGVIDAFRSARQSVPGLQLALLGLSQANDDPEALDVVTNVTEHAAEDPDIHIYFYPLGLPASIDEVVNAFQVRRRCGHPKVSPVRVLDSLSLRQCGKGKRL